MGERGRERLRLGRSSFKVFPEIDGLERTHNNQRVAESGFVLLHIPINNFFLPIKTNIRRAFEPSQRNIERCVRPEREMQPTQSETKGAMKTQQTSNLAWDMKRRDLEPRLVT